MILSSASPAGVALTLAAAVAYAVPAAGASRLSERAARMALVAAWVLHACVLAWGLLGDAPRFGFAPAVSVTAWLVLTVYTVETKVFPELRGRLTAQDHALPDSLGRGAIAAIDQPDREKPLHHRPHLVLRDARMGA